MKRLTFGRPESRVPSRYCRQFRYEETDISYPVDKIRFQVNRRGCLLEFPVGEEQIFGFGLQLKAFNQTDKELFLRVNADPRNTAGDSHAPVPFWVTTAGYGIYLDTARNVEIHCKVRRLKDEADVMAVQVLNAEGIEAYVIEGGCITDITAQYNRAAGGGCSVPEWSLGVLYRCNWHYHQEKVLETARYFRQKDIPCSILGLEPGWHTHNYPCSYVWNQENFSRPDQMIRSLREMGYHLNLWEHAYISTESPLYGAMEPHSADYMVLDGLVPDLSPGEGRALFAEYHRKYLVQEGIDGFKLDECDNTSLVEYGWKMFPNSTQFPSGLDGEQYHNLFGVFYMQTMLDALGECKTFSEVRSAGALSSPYPFALYSDLYDHKDFIRGVVNAGFTGLLWAPELRHAQSAKDLLRRLQTAVFSVQCLINGWYCEDVPWKELGCEEEVRALLKEREKLVPRLKAAFDRYEKTGIPPIRALVMDNTSDRETYDIDDEYLIGEDLIAAPMTAEEEERRVYLPEGRWMDYWTGEEVEAGWRMVRTERIPVYQKIDNHATLY